MIICCRSHQPVLIRLIHSLSSITSFLCLNILFILHSYLVYERKLCRCVNPQRQFQIWHVVSSVVVCETQTRNGREKLWRCAVDFRKVAVDFRGTGACETEVAQGPPAQLTKPCCDQKQKEFRTSWRQLGHPQLASKKSTVKNGDGRAGRGRGGFATPVIFYE